MTLVWLRDVFPGERIVPADEEPWSAWLGLVLGFGMTGLCNVLAMRMFLHVRTQRRRTARLAERLRRAGRGDHGACRGETPLMKNPMLVILKERHRQPEPALAFVRD